MSARPRDYWLITATVLTVAIYLLLWFLKPAGEGFGRGWNLVAYWFYASPVAVVAGVLAFWRSLRHPGRVRTVASVVGVAAVLFPLVALLVMRGKS